MQDRIGGWVFTYHFHANPDWDGELGGEWVGRDQDRVIDLCDEFGLNLIGDDRTGNEVALVDVEQRQGQPEPLEVLGQHRSVLKRRGHFGNLGIREHGVADHRHELDEHPHRAGLGQHPGLRRERDEGKHETRRLRGPLKFFLEGPGGSPERPVGSIVVCVKADVGVHPIDLPPTLFLSMHDDDYPTEILVGPLITEPTIK